MQDNPYQWFMLALEHQAKNKWHRRLKALAIEAEITPAMVSAILNGKSNASVETQAKIANACGYDYIEFLVIGRKLAEGEKPPAKTPPVLLQKIETLDGQGMVALETWLDWWIYVRGNDKMAVRKSSE